MTRSKTFKRLPKWLLKLDCTWFNQRWMVKVHSFERRQDGRVAVTFELVRRDWPAWSFFDDEGIAWTSRRYRKAGWWTWLRLWHLWLTSSEC